MRNLLEHPITPEEVVKCLELLALDNSFEKTRRIGDMTPLLLLTAARIVEAANSVLEWSAPGFETGQIRAAFESQMPKVPHEQ